MSKTTQTLRGLSLGHAPITAEQSLWLKLQCDQLNAWYQLEPANAKKALDHKLDITTDYHRSVSPQASMNGMLSELAGWIEKVSGGEPVAFERTHPDLKIFSRAAKAKLMVEDMLEGKESKESKLVPDIVFTKSVADTYGEFILIENDSFWQQALLKLCRLIDELEKNKLLEPLRIQVEYCRDYLKRNPEQHETSELFSYMNLFQLLVTQLQETQEYVAEQSKKSSAASSANQKLNAALAAISAQWNSTDFFVSKQDLIDKVQAIDTNRRGTKQQLVDSMVVSEQTYFPGLLLETFCEVRLSTNGAGSKFADQLRKILAEDFSVVVDEKENKMNFPVSTVLFFPGFSYDEAYQKTSNGIFNLFPEVKDAVQSYARDKQANAREMVDFLNNMLLEYWFQGRPKPMFGKSAGGSRIPVTSDKLSGLQQLLANNHIIVGPGCVHPSSAQWPLYHTIGEKPAAKLTQKL